MFWFLDLLCIFIYFVQLVQTFSRCVLSCEEVDDLDELLATRLLSFLMDHHQQVLQVPVYLCNAVEDHISYLKSLVSADKPHGNYSYDIYFLEIMFI